MQLNNDELAFVRFMNDDEKIILVTEQGYAIKFTFDDIKPIGRLTSGVKGINLKDGDGITGVVNFSSNEGYVVLITKEGKSKRVSLSENQILFVFLLMKYLFNLNWVAELK